MGVSRPQRRIVMAGGSSTHVPQTVRTVAWIAIVVGAVEAVAGILLIALAPSVGTASTASVVAFGAAAVVVGAVHVLVGRGLLDRNLTALLVGMLATGMKAIFDAIWLILLGAEGVGFAGPLSLVVNALMFAALWNGRVAFPDELGRRAGGNL
jgi:hypothetical protein